VGQLSGGGRSADQLDEIREEEDLVENLGGR